MRVGGLSCARAAGSHIPHMGTIPHMRHRSCEDSLDYHLFFARGTDQRFVTVYTRSHGPCPIRTPMSSPRQP